MKSIYPVGVPHSLHAVEATWMAVENFSQVDQELHPQQRAMSMRCSSRSTAPSRFHASTHGT